MRQFAMPIPFDQIRAFCEKWQVLEFSLFGSILRDDFNADSDVDCLLVFDEQAHWDLWDIIDMKIELKTIFGRDVDIVEKSAIRNPFRRRAILDSQQVIYAA